MTREGDKNEIETNRDVYNILGEKMNEQNVLQRTTTFLTYS